MKKILAFRKIIFVSAYFTSIFKMQMIFEIIIVCCANELKSFSCRMNINLTNSFSAKVYFLKIKQTKNRQLNESIKIKILVIIASVTKGIMN